MIVDSSDHNGVVVGLVTSCRSGYGKLLPSDHRVHSASTAARVGYVTRYLVYDVFNISLLHLVVTITLVFTYI